MSNWKKAYGWYGHILVSSKEEYRSKPSVGLVCVYEHLLRPLIQDHENCELPAPSPVVVRRLGVVDSDFELWATGHSFSKGFEFYGTVFKDAIDRAAQDRAYLEYMKCHYGISLPPCQAMVGCSSEH